MEDIKEVTIDWVQGDPYLTVDVMIPKYIRKTYALKEKYPDEVDIRHVNDDGSLVARMPAKWLQFPKPPAKRDLTDEQREALGARMKLAREKKGKNNGL